MLTIKMSASKGTVVLDTKATKVSVEDFNRFDRKQRALAIATMKARLGMIQQMEITK